MRIILSAIALACATPAIAQTTPPPAAAIDPARLALGQQLANAIWPNGTYARMMEQMIGGDLMNGMLDLKLTDIVDEKTLKTGSKDGKAPADAKQTMREAMKAKDPYFEERMNLTMKAMGEAMAEVFAPLEPKMRGGLAKVYARRFTEPQLKDIAAFFGTPSGKTYASESLMLFTDKALMTEMMSAMPDMLKAMPKVMEKVQKATAHLPPPPKEKDEKAKD